MNTLWIIKLLVLWKFLSIYIVVYF